MNYDSSRTFLLVNSSGCTALSSLCFLPGGNYRDTTWNTRCSVERRVNGQEGMENFILRRCCLLIVFNLPWHICSGSTFAFFFFFLLCTHLTAFKCNLFWHWCHVSSFSVVGRGKFRKTCRKHLTIPESVCFVLDCVFSLIRLHYSPVHFLQAPCTPLTIYTSIIYSYYILLTGFLH